MIKRLILRIIIAFVIATGIMSYIAYLNGIDIRPYIPQLQLPKLSDIKLPSMPDIPLPTGKGQATQAATISKVYKWRGDDGSWHFSEDLPEGVTPEQVIFLNSDTNMVQGLPVPDTVSADISAVNDQAPESGKQQTPTLNPYSPQAIDKLLNDARGVQATMDQRNRVLEEATQAQ